ncbi:MAG TPA: methyltransferase domain-containing protein [Roseiflexaceae bacterium]|nr:methyltransferase domain-containing protein [Roseiflexaceae bacterium]
MYRDVLPYLCCPTCRLTLSPQPIQAADGEIVGGDLVCAVCDTTYPVRDGIADFLGPPHPPTPAQMTNEWPLTAWVYERGWRPFALTLLSGERFPYQRELPLMLGLAEPRRGGLYLDVACSNGLYARALARSIGSRPGHVAAFDHSLPMLKQARAYARAAGLRISFLRAKVQALPVAAHTAAGVVIGGSLNEIGDLDACLAEVRRTLSDDGRYVAMTLARAATAGGRMFQQLMGVGGVVFWTPAELERCFRQHGLRPVARWKYGLVMFHLALPVHSSSQ